VTTALYLSNRYYEGMSNAVGKVNIMAKAIDYSYYKNNYEKLLQEVFPHRRERVKKFKNLQAAYVSLATGLILQEVVKKELFIEPSHIHIVEGVNGKPGLQECPGFHFNLSHSDNVVVIAYGNCPVGIDIEHIEPRNMRVGERCFAKNEYDYVLNGHNSQMDEDMDSRFCHVWTMKEAYVKYTGTGISIPLNSFSIDIPKQKVLGERVELFTEKRGEYIITLCTDEDSEVFWDLDF